MDLIYSDYGNAEGLIGSWYYLGNVRFSTISQASNEHLIDLIDKSLK